MERISMIQQLHQVGANMSMKDSQGRTPFFVAVEDAMDTESDDLKVSETVLGLGSDLKVDEPKKDGVTSLLTVCRRFFSLLDLITKIAGLLLKSCPGINVNIAHPVSGRTPLHFSIGAYQEELTTMLLEAGAGPRIQNS
ncbi:hypothetical protein EDB80DRAFT_887210 [Ilyonectria destructans]|nr:hypothetical protein EDB80DRAFT_887210 [Ilyonectria destructans]